MGPLFFADDNEEIVLAVQCWFLWLATLFGVLELRHPCQKVWIATTWELTTSMLVFSFPGFQGDMTHSYKSPLVCHAVIRCVLR